MRTIVQLLRARDAAAEVAAASLALTEAIVLYERLATKVPRADLDALERGLATAVGIQTLRDIEPAHRAVRRAQERLRCARETKSAPAQVRLIALNAYDHRADLRAAGYRFDPQGYWEDMVGFTTQAAWVRVIDLTDDAALKVAAECIAAARSRGPVDGDGVLNQLSQEVRRA